MVDAFRKQLDALMGANRNGDVEEVAKKYYERDVCRPYLCGLCPHELFQLTKMDMGVCVRIHSLHLKKEYEEAKAQGKENYDRDLEDVLDKLVVECDRKIARALKRLEDDEGASAGAISVTLVTETPEAKALTKKVNVLLRQAEELELQNKMEDKFKLQEEIERLRQERADLQAGYLLDAFNKDRLAAPPPPTAGGAAPHPLGFPGTQVVLGPDVKTQALINEKLKRAEEMGEEGRVDEAQKLMEEAEALKRLGARPDSLLPLLGSNIQIADQKLRVCDICGAFLSIFDSDRRLADHFGGKLHIGYMLIRERLEEIREARRMSKKPSEPRDAGESVERPRRSDREDDRDQDKDRDRVREKEKEKEKERERDRDKERDRDGDRDRDRDRDHRSGRDRDRDRDHDRDRHRERERDRERDYRSRDRDRERDYRGRDRDREYEDRKRSRSRSRDRERRRY